jgi:hypothetical protein
MSTPEERLWARFSAAYLAEAEKQRDDLAVLLKRVVRKLPTDDPLRKQATDYLTRIGQINTMRSAPGKEGG